MLKEIVISFLGFIFLLTVTDLARGDAAAASSGDKDKDLVWDTLIKKGNIVNKLIKLVILDHLVDEFVNNSVEYCKADNISVDSTLLRYDVRNCSMNTMYNLRQIDQWRNAKLDNSNPNYDQEYDEADKILFNRDKILIADDKQRMRILKHVLQPMCTKMTKGLKECKNPGYEEMAKVELCNKSDLWRESEAYWNTTMMDFCRNDGAWIMNFFHTGGFECYSAALRAKDGIRPCVNDFIAYKIEFDQKREDANLTFCKTTGKIGNCFLDRVEKSCKGSTAAVRILRKAFNKTRSFWSVKCGTGALIAAWKSNWIWSFALMATMVSISDIWI